MNCQRTATHQIRAGESLYTIGRTYQMTVEELMALNPGVDPYNLQVGAQLVVCQQPGTQGGTAVPSSADCGEAVRLFNRMRTVWDQHVFWVRMLMLSILSDSGDREAVKARLMKNPQEIASIFAEFYPKEQADRLQSLLTDHLTIGEKLMTFWKNGNMTEANAMNRQWYANAEQIAAALSSMNPYYNKDELYGMLYNHLGSETQQMAQRMARNYTADINAFDQGQRAVLDMADYLANGILRQIYNMTIPSKEAVS